MQACILIVAFVFLVSCVHSSERAQQTTHLQPSTRKPASEPRPGFVSLAELDPSLPTVCGVTLNSDNEILTFQKNLEPQGFQFVELVSGDENWFEKALLLKPRCDLVVVSGHFGGDFFGDHGRLSLEDLETRSCGDESRGFFHEASEVFLFGCNTLAGKDKDHRTPEEYRRALLEHDIVLEQAEQIVALRYSPIGESFSARMSRIFADVPSVYGFDSVGPSGKNVEGLLQNYFDQVPNYATHLKKNRGQMNKPLLTSLKSTAIAQVGGAVKEKNQALARCFLSDSKITDKQKVAWISQTLRDPKKRLANLQEIGSYLIQHGRTGSPQSPLYRQIDDLARDPVLKAEMQTILKTGLFDFPQLRLDLIAVSRYFGWLNETEVNALARDILSKYFEGEMTLENKDRLCSMGTGVGQALTLDLVRQSKPSRYYFFALRCLKPSNPLIHQFLIEMAIDNEDLSVPALRTLAKISGKSFPVLQNLLSIVNSRRGHQLRNAAIDALGTGERIQPQLLADLIRISQAADENPRVRVAAAAWLMTHDPGRFTEPGLQIFSENYNTPEDSVIPEFVVRILAEPQPPGQEESIDAKILRLVARLLKDNRPEVRNYATQIIRKSKTADVTVHQALIEAYKIEQNERVKLWLERTLDRFANWHPALAPQVDALGVRRYNK